MAKQTHIGTLSVTPGGVTGCEQFGEGAAASTGLSTALGYQAAAGNESVALGSNTVATGTGSIAIGQSATCGSYADAGAIGRAAQATADGRITLGLVGGSSGNLRELQVSKGFAAFGGVPPSSQPALVSDPTGGTTQDAEARIAINAILDILVGAGLMAGS